MSVAPSNQLDSPSKTMSDTMSTVNTTAHTSNGTNTSVKVVAVRKLSSTSAGASTSAICNGLLMITESA